MGLNLIPKRCGCPKHPHDTNYPDDGTTHHPGEPCPFEQHLFPRSAKSCCSLQGTIAVRELGALHEWELQGRMFRDMSAEEACAFADQLRAAADRVEESASSRTEKPRGAGYRGPRDKKDQRWPYEAFSTFEEALDSIREAAAWYEKVGSLGYGVQLCWGRE